MILCCGEALIDMIPEMSASGDPCFVPKVGGAVFNTAVALGRLSADVGLFTGVSDDLFGAQITAELSNSNVKTDYLAKQNGPTSLAFVELTDGHASYTFYTQNAADTTLRMTDTPQDDTAIDALFFGGISLCTDPTATTMRDLMRRRVRDCVTMLDPNIRPSFISDEPAYRTRLADMIALADIVKLSDEDLNWLVPNVQVTETQIEKLAGSTSKIFIVTRGRDGADAFVGNTLFAHACATTVTVQDTVGAGDTFNAGVLHSLSQAGALTKSFCKSPDVTTLKNALAFAAKTAAITVSRKGANPPWSHELD